MDTQHVACRNSEGGQNLPPMICLLNATKTKKNCEESKHLSGSVTEMLSGIVPNFKNI